MPLAALENSDDTRGLSQQDIEQLSPKAAVALAARCAMRVAPLLCRSRDFRSSGDRARRDTIVAEAAAWAAAWYASDSPVLSSIAIKDIALAATGLEFANAASAVGIYADDDECAAHAARTTAAANAAAGAASDHLTVQIVKETARASSSSVAAAYKRTSHSPSPRPTAANHQSSVCARAAARTDYELLKGYKGSNVPLQFFSRPLWDSRQQKPPNWDETLFNWKVVLTEIGLLEIYFRHERMLLGEPINWDAIRLWIEQQWKWVQARGDKPPGQQANPSPAPQPSSEAPPEGFSAGRLTMKEFGQLSHWAAVALSIRCAIRVAPIMGLDGSFGYWGDSARQRIVAVESAVWTAAVGLYATLNKPAAAARAAYDSYIFATDAANAVRVVNPERTAEPERVSSAARAVGRAAMAAAYAIYADADRSNHTVRSEYPYVQEEDRHDTVTKVISTAFFGYQQAITAASSDPAFDGAVKMDYDWLLKHATGKTPPDFANFFDRHLWLPQTPENWPMAAWKAALEHIRLPEIYSRHAMMVLGTPVNWVQFEEWVKQHRSEVLSSGGKPPREMVEIAERDWLVSLAINSGIQPGTQTPSASSARVAASFKALVPGDTETASNSSDPVAQPAAVNQADTITDGAIPAAMRDRFAGTDRLGRNHLAQVLAAMFDAPQQATPFTVAILGEWGAGKTAVMKLIEIHLKQAKHRRFYIAEFNAWEYEHTANIRAGLAQEVVKGLVKDLRWWRRAWLKVRYACKEYGAEFLPSLIKFLLFVLPLAGAGLVTCKLFSRTWAESLPGAWAGFVTGGLVFITTAWKHLKTILDHPLSVKLETYLKLPSYGEHLGQVPVIRRQLENLCWLIIPQTESKANATVNGGRLVVFVDDLDRCNSDCIINTLDAVRLVMNIPGTIVVLLMDQRIAMKAVAEKYGELADIDRDKNAIARDYIAKIVQLPIILAASNSENVNGYIREHLFGSAKTSKATSASISARVAPSTPAVERGESVAPAAPLPDSKPVLQPAPATKDEATPPVAATLTQTRASTVTAASLEMGAPAPVPNQPQAGAKAAAQRLQAIQEVMQDTAGDRDSFMAYADLFRLTNPRQLLRLRNSFQVLKGLMAVQSAEHTIPASDTEIVQSLLLLFWLEFISELKQEQREAYIAHLKQNSEVRDKGRKHLSTEEQAWADRIRKEFEQQFGADFCQNEIFLRLKEQAKCLVLPYHKDLEKIGYKYVESNASSSSTEP